MPGNEFENEFTLGENLKVGGPIEAEYRNIEFIAVGIVQTAVNGEITAAAFGHGKPDVKADDDGNWTWSLPVLPDRENGNLQGGRSAQAFAILRVNGTSELKGWTKEVQVREAGSGTQA